jgi:hypothetical protein
LQGKLRVGSDNTSEGTEDEEIDWDEIQVSLDTNKEIDPNIVTKKKSGGTKPRRSVRHANDSTKIQDKAEAAKKKLNEISGNISTFGVFTYVNPSNLENLVVPSNIKLGNSSEAAAAVIDTMQAKEMAKATLLAAKIRVENQAKQGLVESGCPKKTLIQNEERATRGDREEHSGHTDQELVDSSKVRKGNGAEQTEKEDPSEAEREETDSDIEGGDTDVEVIEKVKKRGRPRKRPPKNHQR